MIPIACISHLDCSGAGHQVTVLPSPPPAAAVRGFVRFPLLGVLLLVIAQHVRCLRGRAWLVDLLLC